MPARDYIQTELIADVHKPDVRLRVTQHKHIKNRIGLKPLRFFDRGGVEKETSYLRLEDIPAMMRIMQRILDTHGE